MWVLFCSTAKCYLEQITCMSCINQKKAVSLGLTPMYNTYLSTYLSKKLKVYVDNATKPHYK